MLTKAGEGKPLFVCVITFAYSCQLDIRFLGLVFDLLYSLSYNCLEGICLENSEKITLQGGKSNIFYQVLSGFLLLAEN